MIFALCFVEEKEIKRIILLDLGIFGSVVVVAF
jgi:hypothetical protein